MSLSLCLRRTAFFAETHSIKGWLAIERLRVRFPAIAAVVTDYPRWNQILSAPSVDGVISEQVHWDRASLDDRRLASMIRGAVYPMAYVAAVESARRHGLRALIDADADRALRRLGNLGHSYTVHKSFVEVVEHLEGDVQRDLCAERYAEFVASQLAVNDGSKEDAKLVLDGGEIDTDEVIDTVFTHPGFLGHSLITLGYLLRYRTELDAARWRFALHQLRAIAVPSAKDARDVERQRGPGDPTEQTLARAIETFVEQGPREVHTVTLADVACDVWDGLPDRRTAVEDMLLRFARIDVIRSAGGEHT